MERPWSYYGNRQVGTVTAVSWSIACLTQEPIAFATGALVTLVVVITTSFTGCGIVQAAGTSLSAKVTHVALAVCLGAGIYGLLYVVLDIRKAHMPSSNPSL